MCRPLKRLPPKTQHRNKIPIWGNVGCRNSGQALSCSDRAVSFRYNAVGGHLPVVNNSGVFGHGDIAVLQGVAALAM
jgi:hypothetical protein